MVKVHKRKKNSRIRGARTCGWGFRQKHKGHGNKGGLGMAGSGKRADHKKQKAKESDTKKKTYFGKQGLTSRGSKRVKVDKMNLSDIQANLYKKAGETIELSKYTILGNGEGFKAKIKAKKASTGAIEKMKKAGGEIILPDASAAKHASEADKIGSTSEASKKKEAPKTEKASEEKAPKVEETKEE